MAIMRTRQLRMPSKQMLPHVVTKAQARAAAPRGHTLIVKAESGDNTVRMSLDLYSALQVHQEQLSPRGRVCYSSEAICIHALSRNRL
jgi:hypothetical protein